MVRLLPSKRWSRERLQRITTTPSLERPIALEQIEGSANPHDVPDAPHDDHLDVDDEPKHTQPRRVKNTLRDLKGVGFTPNCPKCNLHLSGENATAHYSHHTELCRTRVYEELRKAGSSKIISADASGRTRSGPSQSSSSKEPILLAREDADDVEEFGVQLDGDDVLLKDLVADAPVNPSVSDEKACA